LIDLLTDWLA